jgi:dipeptidyl-peptidase-3
VRQFRLRSGSVLVRRSICLTLLLALGACDRRVSPPGAAPPSPAPDSLSAAPPAFAVSAETFADVRILRYRVHGFEALPLPKKVLLYMLHEAALSGRDITYDQRYRHNLTIRRTLEALVSAARERTDAGASEAEDALLLYLKRIWFANGVHDANSNRKFVPEGVSPEEFARLVRSLDPKALPRQGGESVEAFLTRITPIIFDPRIDAQRVNKDPGRDPVADSANHFYVELDRARVQAFMQQKLPEDAAAPPSFGLNSQLVGHKDGAVEERVYRVGGLYGEALEECVRWLTRALPWAENAAQRSALEALIAFYQSGRVEDFDHYNVAWVKDTESSIDLIHGFIETYGDPLGLRGTYEALLELVDVDATRRIRALGGEAAWFEQHSPIADAYKKEEIVGIHARVVQAVMSAGDTAPTLPIGVNLPNSSWIRLRHGSKSVTLGNILEAYEAEARDNGVLAEFAASEREVARARSHGPLAHALLVDMHEVIGHASGKLAPGVGDVSSTLGHYGSTLEEARADLVALYYLLDPKLIELKVAPSLEVGRAAYDAYLRSALVQIASVPEGEQLEEDHMRNQQLIVHWALREGAAHKDANGREAPRRAPALERVSRGGKTYYVVHDYPRLRQLFGRLLKEVQRIKSEGDLPAARDLVDGLGVHIEPALHKEVRTRYAALHLAPHSGFIQPELTPVSSADQIVDVRIEYPTDFAAQQLRYSAKYSFLPANP